MGIRGKVETGDEYLEAISTVTTGEISEINEVICREKAWSRKGPGQNLVAEESSGKRLRRNHPR